MITGILSLLTGLAYTGLAVITVYELVRHRHDRGFSHFGLAFAVMAFTCGPHHLMHAYRHLWLGEAPHGPMLAAVALGAAPAVVFIARRVEATFGGRGDRLVRASNRILPLAAWGMTWIAGVFFTCAISHLVAGLLTGAHTGSVVFDNVGVPASFYFMWATYRVSRDSARDWNRRPLVGRAAPLGRRSPWADQSA